MTTKAELHELVEQLPESETETAARVLIALRDTADPFLRFLNQAPEDDEPVTAEDEAAIREGREASRRGEVRTWEEVRREL
jgi:hypothetical protein